MNDRPFVVGLTGGIGSGKSTVAGMLATLGVPVLDLDKLGHTVLMSADIRGALRRHFGPEVLHEDGSPDRKRIGKIALATAEGAQQLGDIVHPYIWREAKAWVADQRAPYVVIEASVLIESKGTDHVDFVVVVMADLDVRRHRVALRKSHDHEALERIVARQCNDDERRRVADRFVLNNGELGDLKKAVEALHADLLAMTEAGIR